MTEQKGETQVQRYQYLARRDAMRRDVLQAHLQDFQSFALTQAGASSFRTSLEFVKLCCREEVPAGYSVDDTYHVNEDSISFDFSPGLKVRLAILQDHLRHGPRLYDEQNLFWISQIPRMEDYHVTDKGPWYDVMGCWM